jgi:hypothetical protein
MDINYSINHSINDINNLSLTNENTFNTMDENILVNTMNSLSLENQSSINNVSEPYKTYYDYDIEEYNNVDNDVDIDIDIERNENSEDIEIKTDTFDTSPYVCFGIPNIYCNDLLGDFDDEDFIFNRYDLPNYIKKYIKYNNSIGDYVNNYCVGNGIILNYSDTNNSPELLYAKILYIYHYVYHYYKDLKHLKPIERLSLLPDNLLYFVENVITILKTMVNEDELNSKELVEMDNLYFKELIYGLHIIIKELSTVLNHYKFCKLWQLEDTHVKMFFKMVNNLCVIIIYMKLNHI